jgi:hypothetical protein
MPLDSYTPTEFQQLQNADADLGSTAPAILPTVPASQMPHLAVQSGKDAKIRLLNRDNLSGAGGPAQVGGELQKLDVPQGGAVLTQPAVWANPTDGSLWVFIANAQGISGLQLVVDGAGTPSLSPRWSNTSGGTSPIIANDILYSAGPRRLSALDPTSGVPLWSDGSIGNIHWESPIVVNGTLFVTDENAMLWAYGSTDAVLSVTPSSLNFGAVTVNTTTDLTFTVQNTGGRPLMGTAAAAGAPFRVVAGSPFSVGAGASQIVTVRFSPTSGATFNSNVNVTSNAGTLSRLVTGEGQTFSDVAADDPFWTWIEALVRVGVTGGCGTNPARYCPGDSVTRAQMAVFLLRGKAYPGSANPSPATGTVFADIPVSYPLANWVEALYVAGLTGGCATNPLRFCPDDVVTRGATAVFLLRAKHGAGYDPPAPTQQTFADVPLNHPFAKWIYQLAAEGITGGCAMSPAQYCPDASVTRAQMAVFLIRAFSLPM